MTQQCLPAPPLVSVVMSVYNPHPDYFPQAVRSILYQSLPDLELIIVEDPSPRSGQCMLAGIRDGRVRHIANPRRTSAASQRNRGVAEARGRFVAVFDADDIAEPDRLREQIDLLSRHPDVGVVGSQIIVIDPEGRVRGYRHFPTDHAAIVRTMPRNVPLSHPSVTFRREVLAMAGGYNLGVYPAEDVELFFRLAKSGVRFANHPEPLIRYRLHSEQTKATHFRATVRNVIRLKQLYWSDDMGWGCRLRLWAERAVLLLPTRLALRLIAHQLYSEKRLPVRTPAIENAVPAGRIAVPAAPRPSASLGRAAFNLEA